MAEVTDEDVKAAIQADKRFALINMASAVAAELRDCEGLKIFLMALRKEAEDALVEFADANIANPIEIMPLQVRVRSIVFLNRTIEELMNSARNAEDHLMNEVSEFNDG